MARSVFPFPGSKICYFVGIFGVFQPRFRDFNADFHRKMLDIVKQHPNNDKIWADRML